MVQLHRRSLILLSLAIVAMFATIAPASTSGPPDGKLSIEVDPCQDDAFPGEAGLQIAVELRMSDLLSNVAGFAAFIDYDTGNLAYRGDLSSYTSTPFPLHILPIVQPDDGLLDLDGSDSFGGGGTSVDSLLVTLVFTVAAECTTTTISYESGGPFPSELSFQGNPLVTDLVAPAPFILDDTPPVIIQADLMVPLLPDECVATVAYSPVTTDSCDPNPTLFCCPRSGSVFVAGTTQVICTSIDFCGNTTVHTFNVTVMPISPCVPPGTPYCFGTSCPCGNDFPTAGCRNSTGCGGLLTATGIPSIMTDGLALIATGLPPNNTGLFFVGKEQFIPPVFVGDGFGCAGGGMGGNYRYVTAIDPMQVDAAGNFVKRNTVRSAPFGFFVPGGTVNFQAWTRDVLCGPPPNPCPSPCGNNNNLTNAYSVVFVP